MPIHFDDRDVVSEVGGSKSALIVPCNMCPAVTVAVREGRPFIRFFRNLLKSAPFEDYLRELQSRLTDNDVKTSVFRSDLPHEWFMCMWTSGRRKKLAQSARQHEAVVVMGCSSATETVRRAVKDSDCRVIEGMETAGIVNATLRFHWPGDVSFGDCTVIPISNGKNKTASTS